MNFTRCDNCGEIITIGREWNHVTFADYLQAKISYDLCQLCRDTIENAIKQVKK